MKDHCGAKLLDFPHPVYQQSSDAGKSHRSEITNRDTTELASEISPDPTQPNTMKPIDRTSGISCLCAAFIRRRFITSPRFRAGAALYIACLSSLLFVPSDALAQINQQCFLKIDAIQGESTSPGYQNEIDVLGFNAGVERAISSGGGGAKSTTKPQFYEISVSKNVDKTSPLLFVNCAVGRVFPTATLTLAKEYSTGLRDYFKIVLSNVTITKLETRTLSGTNGSLTEEVTLGFQTIRWSITSIDPASGQETVVATGGYDLGQNRAL